MAGLTGSYVNETTAVNLTALGAEDALSYNTAGTLQIVKTGGGALITVTPWDYGSGLPATTDGTGGGFQNRQMTTTDFTASNITNKASCNYMQSNNRGYKMVFPAGTGERTVKLYLGHYLEGGSTDLNLTCTLSDGSAGPYDPALSLNLNSDIDLTATIVYTAGAPAQTLTIDYYATSTTACFLGFRGAWISTAGGGASTTGRLVSGSLVNGMLIRN
jgi:hypothetical protein